jgi:hypothetical protein
MADETSPNDVIKCGCGGDLKVRPSSLLDAGDFFSRTDEEEPLEEYNWIWIDGECSKCGKTGSVAYKATAFNA